jgi:RNA polymerase sigma-70 factor (ECF subfamily)
MTARSLRCVPAVSEADAVSFVRARPRLFGIARRVLGSAADADDVVQEAWVRWQETDRSKVRDPAAFLATTTTRLALNVGQSARARRETDIGPRLLDAVDPAADPVRGAEQGEALALALRTVLEKLSPTERAVYVLREAFEYPHRRIAEVVGLSEVNARQLVTRARRRIAGEPRWTVDAAEHERLVDTFVAAAQRGDLARLEQLLAADVSVEEGSRVRIAA